jgi:hypothetical protein
LGNNRGDEEIMNAELSQRVAQLMHTFIIMKLTLKEKNRFVENVADSKDFDSLTKNSKTLIRKAEKELDKERERFYTD